MPISRRYADLRLKERAAPASVNRELAALRRAFRLAVRHGLLLGAPPVPALREDNVRTGFFEPDQFEAVCRNLREIEADVVRFCYHTGWRSKSEVFPLTWAQVDWAGGLVRLEPGTTKNREGRAFPITPALRLILERRQDYTPLRTCPGPDHPMGSSTGRLLSILRGHRPLGGRGHSPQLE